jgi:hypothetical protein
MRYQFIVYKSCTDFGLYPRKGAIGPEQMLTVIMILQGVLSKSKRSSYGFDFSICWICLKRKSERTIVRGKAPKGTLAENRNDNLSLDS